VVGLLPCLAQSAFDRVAVAFGEVVKHVAFFVLHAALDRGLVAEYLADSLAQGFSALNAVTNFEFECLIDRIRGLRRRNRP
jgi:hypothetical protein